MEGCFFCEADGFTNLGGILAALRGLNSQKRSWVLAAGSGTVWSVGLRVLTAADEGARRLRCVCPVVQVTVLAPGCANKAGVSIGEGAAVSWPRGAEGPDVMAAASTCSGAQRGGMRAPPASVNGEQELTSGCRRRV